MTLTGRGSAACSFFLVFMSFPFRGWFGFMPIATITLTGALLLGIAAPASAHTININVARGEAADLARDVYLGDDSNDYGWAGCTRQSLHRVTCFAVTGYDDGSECWTRVTTQLSRTSYRYSVHYGVSECD